MAFGEVGYGGCPFFSHVSSPSRSKEANEFLVHVLNNPELRHKFLSFLILDGRDFMECAAKGKNIGMPGSGHFRLFLHRARL